MNTKGWTVETLKEHFEALLAEKEKTDKVIQDTSKEAVSVAERNSEKWRDNANEWRAAMNDREKKFVDVSVFEIYKGATERAEKERRENEALNRGRELGKKELIALIMGGFLLAGSIVGIILKFIGK